MGKKVKITEDQLTAVLAQLFAADKEAAEALIEKARKAAEAGREYVGVQDMVHGRGVSC